MLAGPDGHGTFGADVTRRPGLAVRLMIIGLP
jgi:hypothetical protein